MGVMPHHATTLAFDTPGPGLTEITGEVADWLASTGVGTGLLTAFCRHTSASLLINENAAPAVRGDMLRWLDRLAPQGAHYAHDDEGPDDMPAHLKAALTGASHSIPVIGGRLALGTWQGLFLVEHRARPHRREIALHLGGD
jgi:secondary thiamine-phosphate synthase enzyme